MPQKKDVKFIRRNGRVIPIRSKDANKALIRILGHPKPPPKKKPKKSLFQGVGLVAAGLGVSALSGFAAGKLFKSAVKSGQEAINLTKGAKFSFDFKYGGTEFGEKVQEVLLKGAGKKAKKTATKIKLSKGILKFSGNVVAGAIAGEGIAKIIEELKGSRTNEVEHIASSVGGFVAVEAAQRAFKKGVGKKLILKLVSRGKF